MHIYDWLIFATYLVASVAIALWLRKRASSDLESYFVAGRKMSGWLVGTSMVATTFAADTPLAVTGIVAKNGIAGNWFWWSLAFSHLMAAFVFARMWRRAEVITDAELVELRYDGQLAAWLRGLRAFFFAVPINCIIMAWVIRAMGKIVGVLFPWDKWLGDETYGRLLAVWPDGISVSSPSEGISIILGVTFATIYASLGGLPAVIITDLLQFGLAMIGSIILAYRAVEHIGGLGAIGPALERVYGPRSEEIVAFMPSGDAAWLPVEAFLVFVLVQWWAQKFSDGGGIIVQRMSAAKSPGHALGGTALFAFMHYVVRPWPWILVGLVAMIMYPLAGSGVAATAPGAAAVLADREMAYPVLMAALLPPGVLGIMVTAMAAAFMSTIDTHITRGASYLTSDIYRRFLRPGASEAELVRVGRFSMLVIVVMALIITTQIGTIESAWKFLTAFGAGMGLVSILRWVWWRINAAAELAGMFSAAIMAIGLWAAGLQSGPEALPYWQLLLTIVAFSTVAVAVAIWLGPQTSTAQLRRFHDRVKPFGAWAKVTDTKEAETKSELSASLGAWGCACCGLFLLLFGVGEWLLGSTMVGVAASVAGGALWMLAFRLALARD